MRFIFNWQGFIYHFLLKLSLCRRWRLTWQRIIQLEGRNKFPNWSTTDKFEWNEMKIDQYLNEKFRNLFHPQIINPALGNRIQWTKIKLGSRSINAPWRFVQVRVFVSVDWWNFSPNWDSADSDLSSSNCTQTYGWTMCKMIGLFVNSWIREGALLDFWSDLNRRLNLYAMETFTLKKIHKKFSYELENLFTTLL